MSKNYENQTISVLSSHTNRTVVSAQSLLMGLYPAGTGPVLKNNEPAIQGRFQPIPIMTLTEDSKLIGLPYEYYLGVLKKKISTILLNGFKKLKKVSIFLKNGRKILGNKISSLADVITVGDVLIVAKAHGKPLPDGLSQADADKIIELTDWGLAQQFKSQKVAYILYGELTNKILVDLKILPMVNQNTR